MNTPPTVADSRRGFLKRLFVAAATGGALATTTRVQAGDAESDVVRPFSVGDVRIAEHVVGPILVRADDYDYLLFDAHRTDRRGRSVGTGTAVVRLTQCAARRVRTDGDQDLRGWAADPSDLDAAGTYEVHNSSWVLDLVEGRPELLKGPALHHCVFTFRETHFECVLARYDFTVHDGAFDALLAELTESP